MQIVSNRHFWDVFETFPAAGGSPSAKASKNKQSLSVSFSLSAQLSADYTHAPHQAKVKRTDAWLCQLWQPDNMGIQHGADRRSWPNYGICQVGAKVHLVVSG